MKPDALLHLVDGKDRLSWSEGAGAPERFYRRVERDQHTTGARTMSIHRRSFVKLAGAAGKLTPLNQRSSMGARRATSR